MKIFHEPEVLNTHQSNSARNIVIKFLASVFTKFFWAPAAEWYLSPTRGIFGTVGQTAVSSQVPTLNPNLTHLQKKKKSLWYRKSSKIWKANFSLITQNWNVIQLDHNPKWSGCHFFVLCLLVGCQIKQKRRGRAVKPNFSLTFVNSGQQWLTATWCKQSLNKKIIAQPLKKNNFSIRFA